MFARGFPNPQVHTDLSDIQNLGVKGENYTADFNNGKFINVTTGGGVATITIPDWAGTSTTVECWLVITQGATPRIQTISSASNVISSGGLMSAGDALSNSGLSTVDAFKFTWNGIKWITSDALFDVKN